MTVDEMIIKLQILSMQGHGGIDVVMTENDGCGYEEATTSIEMHLVATEYFDSHGWYIKTYWKTEENGETYMVKDTPFLYLKAA